MTNELIVKDDAEMILKEISDRNKMCQALLTTDHYRKLGADGVFAIVEKARSIGINPLEALNGGMYYVRGKVEMTSGMMNQMIRMRGHSVTKDKKSNDEECILHGKRADNGDTWVESFSLADAKRAGIYQNQWLKYPKDMLFARALSRLARQLFPDVIKGCYVEGEIKDAPAFNAPVKQKPEPQNDEETLEIVTEPVDGPKTITNEQYEELEEWMGNNIILRQNILTFLKKRWGIEKLQDMPIEIYDHAMRRAKEQYKHEHAGEQTQMGA